MCCFTTLHRTACRRCLPALATAAIIAALASSAAADLNATITTDADTTNLFLQQPVVFEVAISGLEPGQQLDFLGITVAMDAYRMGTPNPITRGGIVPTPGADPSDFLTARAPGIADASFYCSGTLPTQRITSNGTFFTFTLTPQHAGSVPLEITFADALLHNPADPESPIPLTITAAGTLEVVVFCPADFNNDGGIDGTDVQDFFDAWESATGLSDVNGDGGIDGADVVTFFDAWESGGC